MHSSAGKAVSDGWRPRVGRRQDHYATGRSINGNQPALRAKPVAEQFQAIFDWVTHDNNLFECADFLRDVYHQYKRTGRLTMRQEAAVRKIASLKAVRLWHLANTTLKGTGIPPPEPEDEGCLIMDDDDD